MARVMPAAPSRQTALAPLVYGTLVNLPYDGILRLPAAQLQQDGHCRGVTPPVQGIADGRDGAPVSQLPQGFDQGYPVLAVSAVPQVPDHLGHCIPAAEDAQSAGYRPVQALFVFSQSPCQDRQGLLGLHPA